MQHVFWLRTGKIAGRCGPDLNGWDLEEIKANGFSSVLSVNNGESVHETLLSRLGIAYSTIPMSPNAPPETGDKSLCLGNLPRAMDFIKNNLDNGPVLIHCHSGKDRTALVMGAYLIMFEGCTPKNAMDEILSVRPIAFSAEGWMSFGLEVLDQFFTDKAPLTTSSGRITAHQEES